MNYILIFGEQKYNRVQVDSEGKLIILWMIEKYFSVCHQFLCGLCVEKELSFLKC